MLVVRLSKINLESNKTTNNLSSYEILVFIPSLTVHVLVYAVMYEYTHANTHAYTRRYTRKRYKHTYMYKQYVYVHNEFIDTCIYLMGLSDQIMYGVCAGALCMPQN